MPLKPKDQFPQPYRPTHFYKYKFIDESCLEHARDIFTNHEL